jgi:hemin uptake protein HemP
MRIIIISDLAIMNTAGSDVSTSQREPSATRHVDVAVPAIPSSELLQGQPHVPIEHGGAVYWLRATRSGKLILTK